MTIRRLEYLINDVRLSTDNLDTNGIKDREFVRYFNDAIRMAQLLVFKNMPLSNHFQETEIYTNITPDAQLTLPAPCYADNAVSTVEGKSGIS